MTLTFNIHDHDVGPEVAAKHFDRTYWVEIEFGPVCIGIFCSADKVEEMAEAFRKAFAIREKQSQSSAVAAPTACEAQATIHRAKERADAADIAF